MSDVIELSGTDYKEPNGAPTGRLVTIVVRTKDRPKLLLRALISIAAQTYRPLEVVMVNDGGCDLDISLFRNILKGVSLVYVPISKNIGRAGAANAGLRQASGEFIGFLDDDDEFYPEHVLTLVAAIDRTGYKFAYSDVEMIMTESHAVAGNGHAEERTIFSRDFSYPDLLICNYVPFISFLARREVIELAGLLDEEFDFYEDWDFLIRIAEKAPFYHEPLITATYHQWDRSLQINQRDDQYSREMHIKVLEKHRDKITAEGIFNLFTKKETGAVASGYNGLISNMAEKDALLAEKETMLAEKETMLAEKETMLAEKDALLFTMENALEEKQTAFVKLEARIEQMQETLGWRILEVLRRLREHVCPLGTARRRVYDLGIRAINYIKREGFRRFAEKIRQRYDISAPFSDADAYQLWIMKNEPDQAGLQQQKKLSEQFALKPLISIITPVFNPEQEVFIGMLESVLVQTYKNWELCLADASSETYVKDIIEAYAKADSRIKVKYLKQNKGISGNSNEALSMASGEFVALLDHDDALAPFALFEVIRAVNECPGTDFIYSDRDKISYDNRRFDPFFKPGWSPDYLLSQNYLCHLNVFLRDRLCEIGGFREGYDGSQDYDLVLRLTELTDKILHIPKVLYHWRVVTGSAAGDPHAKPYAYDAAIRSLQDSLDRRGWKGVVTQDSQGLYRVRLQLKGSPMVSIFVPYESKGRGVRRCIDSVLQRTSYDNYEVVVVMSTDDLKESGYWQYLVDLPRVRLFIDSRPCSFSEKVNRAVSETKAGYMVFLDGEVEVITEKWLEFMLGFAQREETGAVGGKLLCFDGVVYSAGLLVDEFGNVRRSHCGYPADSAGDNGRLRSLHNVSAVSPILMVKKAAFEKVMGFSHEFDAFGNIDFCFKLRKAGYVIVCDPYTVLCYHSVALNEAHEELLNSERKDFVMKWGDELRKGDPFYNINLASDKEDFSIR